MRRSHHEAIIFDFNGVLLWDTAIHEQVWKEFAASLRGAPLSDEEIAVHMHGRTNQHLLEYLLGRALPDTEIQRLSEEKETIYRTRALALGADYQLSPGAVELLDFLVEHNLPPGRPHGIPPGSPHGIPFGRPHGIPYTIATASGKGNLDFFIQHLDLGRWFDLDRIVYDDGSLPGKPAPQIYLQAARNLNVPPAHCIVVEDSLSGLQAAHAAGIGCIIALGPPQRHAALRQVAGVTTVISSLAEFPRQMLISSRPCFQTKEAGDR